MSDETFAAKLLDNIMFKNPFEATIALRELSKIIDTYGQASIGNWYQILGMGEMTPIMNKFVWTDISEAKVSTVTLIDNEKQKIIYKIIFPVPEKV